MLHTGGAGAAAATLQNHYAWLEAITISNRLLAGRLFQMVTWQIGCLRDTFCGNHCAIAPLASGLYLSSL
jgi:hypothetical protein